MTILGLIPARGGSKGIPRKNLASCGGKSLMAWTIEAARGSKLSRVFLSTDDAEIAAYGKEKGLEVPFLRPSELSGDTAPMVEVVRHFLDFAEREGMRPDGVMLLQPTSPLRRARHIDQALKLFEAKRPVSLVSVVVVPHSMSPLSQMREEGGELFRTGEPIYRRQDKPVFYVRNGPAILIASPAAIRSGDLYAPPCAAYIMDKRSSFDIDDSEDIAIADALIAAEKRNANS